MFKLTDITKEFKDGLLDNKTDLYIDFVQSDVFMGSDKLYLVGSNTLYCRSTENRVELILKRLKNQYRNEHIFIRGIYSLGYVNSVEILNVKLAINPTLNYIIATNKASATEQILNKYNIVSIDEAKKTNGIAVVGDYSVEDKLNNIKGNPVIIMLYKFTGEQANTIKIPVLYKTDKITNIFNKI